MQAVVKKPIALEQQAEEENPAPLEKHKSENSVDVMQEYHPDLKNDAEEAKSDMPALHPDEFGNETYDPNMDDVEISIGEFIPVPPLESLETEGNNEEEMLNLPGENLQQDPNDLLVERGEMIIPEEKSIGKLISADKNKVTMDDLEPVEAKEIGDYRPVDSSHLD